MAGATWRASRSEPSSGWAAATKADRRTGQELRRYLLAKSGPRPWLSRIDTISVDDRRITVGTDLKPDAEGKRIARRVCSPDSRF